MAVLLTEQLKIQSYSRALKSEKVQLLKIPILMQDTVVGENAKLNCVITDKNVNIKMVLSYQAHQHSLFLFSKGTRI